MKLLNTLLLTSTLALAEYYPYEGTPSDVQLAQEENQAETSALFNALSDGEYEAHRIERYGRLEHKETLKNNKLALEARRAEIVNDTSIDSLTKEELLIQNAEEINAISNSETINERKFYENEEAMEISNIAQPEGHNVSCDVGDTYCEEKVEENAEALSNYNTAMNVSLLPEEAGQKDTEKLYGTAEQANGALPFQKAAEEEKDYGDLPKSSKEKELNDPKLDDKATYVESSEATQEGQDILAGTGTNTEVVRSTYEAPESIEEEDNAAIDRDAQYSIDNTQNELGAFYGTIPEVEEPVIPLFPDTGGL